MKNKVSRIYSILTEDISEDTKKNFKEKKDSVAKEFNILKNGLVKIVGDKYDKFKSTK